MSPRAQGAAQHRRSRRIIAAVGGTSIALPLLLGGSLAAAQAPAPTAVLGPIVSNSSGTQASARATFTPVRKGQTAELQVRTIVTTETNEVTRATWKTLDTARQNARGVATFDLDDPLEVSHSYRAVTKPTGGAAATVSAPVTFAAPATTKKTGLSTVYFNSNEGRSVNTRARYFEGEFSMTASSAQPECQAVARIPKSTMKGRGNYSWTFAKKSFTLKLDKSTDLCGMGKSKKWALIAGAYDKSLMRTLAAMNLGSKLTGMAWTPQVKPVDLYVNGSYRGNYLLVERITVDSDRVDIDELVNGSEDPTGANDRPPNITGGYILEWDFRRGADHNVTAGSRGWVGIKEPENEADGTGITKKQVSYVNSALDAADKALFGRSFTDDTTGWKAHIDQASAVDYYIAQELTKPVDGQMWASTYMYKARGGKLYFGPMWDYDLAMGSADRAGGTKSATGWYLRNPVKTPARQSAETWFNRLNDDPDFRAAVRKRWQQVAPQLKAVDAYLAGQQKVLTPSANANFAKWDVKQRMSPAQVVRGSWPKETAYLRGWLRTRIAWMDQQY